MDTFHKRGAIVRSLALILVAGAVLGSTGCQSTVAATSDRANSAHAVGAGAPAGYQGLPADRIEQEIQRQIARGLRPSSTCVRHTVVEHPDGGFHLVCVQTAE